MAETAALLVNGVLPRQPIRQWGSARFAVGTHFVMRSTLARESLSGAVREAVGSVDSAAPLVELFTQRALVDRLLRTEQLGANGTDGT